MAHISCQEDRSLARKAARHKVMDFFVHAYMIIGLQRIDDQEEGYSNILPIKYQNRYEATRDLNPTVDSSATHELIGLN